MPTLTLTPNVAGSLYLTAPYPLSFISFFNVKDYGAVGDGVTDDRAACQAAVTAAAAVGGIVYFPKGTYYLGSVGPLTILANQPIVFRGAGRGITKIKLSATCPRFVKPLRVADYDLFTNITIEDLDVDANNVNGVASVIFGTYSDIPLRLNFDGIYIRRVNAYNLPTDPLHNLGHMLGIHLFSYHVTAGEATQTYVKNITIEDVKISGGNYGIAVGGASSGVAATVNVLADNIKVIRCTHTMTGTPTVSAPNNNFQFGSICLGGSLWVENCVGENATDTAFEINNFTEVTIKGCIARDASNYGFLHRQFQAPVGSQQIIMSGCRAETVNLVPSAALPSRGFSIANDTDNASGIATGDITIRDCSQTNTTRTIWTEYGSAILTGNFIPIKSLTIENFDHNMPACSLNTPSADNPVAIAVRMTGAALSIKGVRLVWAGTKAGAGSVSPTGIQAAGNNGALPTQINIEDVYFDCNITNMLTTSPVDIGEFAGSIMTGVVRRLAVARSTGTNKYGVITGTSALCSFPTPLIVAECDFTAATTAKVSPGSGNEKNVWWDSGIVVTPLTANWSNNGGTLRGGGYQKTADGRVKLEGILKTAAGATNPAFTLPAGFRPSLTLSFPYTIYNGAAYAAGEVSIANTGTVSLFPLGTAAGNQYPLEGITFRADA